MCGIAGIWHLNGENLKIDKLKRLTDSLSHRGPDGSGYDIYDSVIGLGHRRLSILDLSDAGRQPMTYEDSDLFITYNGEVYNFVEIRKELEFKGYKFKSNTDTEVILASYLEWGFDCFNRFNGMWAIALYEKKKKKLLLIRDRFGVKPLYYLFLPGKLFAFASETIAFKNLEEFKLETEENNISEAIDNPVLLEGTGYTIWKNVFQVLPGHYFELRVDSQKIQQKRWFKIPTNRSFLSYDEATNKVKELISEAVNIRMRSDVPVGCALSGGLDSSTIYSLIHYLKSKGLDLIRSDYGNVKAFVATFEGTKQDESEYAKFVVKHWQGKANFIEADFKNLPQQIEQSTKLFNDISASPLVALTEVYREMRDEGVYVSLDGHGVDEMLYGYKSLVGMSIIQSAAEGNFKYQSDLLQTYTDMFAEEEKIKEKSKMEVRTAAYIQSIGLDSKFGRMTYFLKQKAKAIIGKTEINALPLVLTNEFLLKRKTEPLPEISNSPINLAGFNLAEKELIIDFYHRNIPYNLRDFDRAAMQHGVEIRMPFMDYNLVNFIFSLPMSYKVGHGYTKRVLRDAIKGITPDLIRNRKSKIGMAAPTNVWFNLPLSEYILDTVKSNSFLESNLWNGPAVASMVEKNTKEQSWDNEDAQKFWNILNAYLIR